MYDRSGGPGPSWPAAWRGPLCVSREGVCVCVYPGLPRIAEPGSAGPTAPDCEPAMLCVGGEGVRTLGGVH